MASPAIRSPAPLSLENLWRIFPEESIGPPPRARSVEPAEIPQLPRSLLVHERHMTLALEEHHHAPVVLRALERVHSGESYARRLALEIGSTGAMSLFGIMRIDLSVIDPRARAEILLASRPLGAILMQYEALRRIEPVDYLRLEATPGILEALRRRDGSAGGSSAASAAASTAAASPPVLYGRLALIHCGGRPAVELLEVVNL